MKVITKQVISLDTLEIIEEESFEYSGSLALCGGGGDSGGGGSAGGGGGGSGAVTYPAHVTSTHHDWLNNTGLDGAISVSVQDAMEAAFGNSPWTAETAYDPDSDIVQLLAAPDDLQTLVTLLSSGTGLDTLISEIMDDARVDAVVTEYAADLDARLTAEVLPRFNAGMRNINAVVSSAYVLGLSNIEANNDRQVAKFSADLHAKTHSDDAIKIINLKLEYQRVVAALTMEAYRVKIVAKKEEVDLNLKIEESDALWDLEVFQYGSNVLASAGGGVATPNTKKPTQGQSMLGGALSGAAAGAMIGGAPGAVIGGILGAASGLL